MPACVPRRGRPRASWMHAAHQELLASPFPALPAGCRVAATRPPPTRLWRFLLYALLALCRAVQRASSRLACATSMRSWRFGLTPIPPPALGLPNPCFFTHAHTNNGYPLLLPRRIASGRVEPRLRQNARAGAHKSNVSTRVDTKNAAAGHNHKHSTSAPAQGKLRPECQGTHGRSQCHHESEDITEQKSLDCMHLLEDLRQFAQLHGLPIPVPQLSDPHVSSCTRRKRTTTTYATLRNCT